LKGGDGCGVGAAAGDGAGVAVAAADGDAEPVWAPDSAGNAAASANAATAMKNRRNTKGHSPRER
jgi:hypothetical protein